MCYGEKVNWLHGTWNCKLLTSLSQMKKKKQWFSWKTLYLIKCFYFLKKNCEHKVTRHKKSERNCCHVQRLIWIICVRAIWNFSLIWRVSCIVRFPQHLFKSWWMISELVIFVYLFGIFTPVRSPGFVPVCVWPVCSSVWVLIWSSTFFPQPKCMRIRPTGSHQ